MVDRAFLRDALAAACFLAFVCGAWWTGRRTSDERARRRRATVYTALVLAVTLAVGAMRRDLYPFTSWPLLGWIFPDSIAYMRFVVVGADGREYPVDYRAWQPLGVDELSAWMHQEFPRLTPARQREAGAFLLHRASSAAALARSGEPIGDGRLLGPLAAPYFLLHPTRWSGPGQVPPGPLRALRVYSDSWVIEARARDTGRVVRQLRYEFEPRR